MPDDIKTDPPEDQVDDSTATTPWSNDLEAAFEDEDIRTKVSEFLGDKVQPYVTRIEQEARPSRDASRLWEQFNENPVDTYIQVSRELYGPDVADQVAAVLQGGEPKPPDADDDTDVDEEVEVETGKQQISFDDLPPEVQNAVAAQQQEEQRTAYYAEIDRITDERKDDLPKDEEDKPKLDVDIFHPFVVAANGDFDKAADAYFAWRDRARDEFGIKVPDKEDIDTPPVINSNTKDSSTAPPQVEEYETLDDAIDSFFKEQDNPPPTVGNA